MTDLPSHSGLYKGYVVLSCERVEHLLHEDHAHTYVGMYIVGIHLGFNE